MTKTTPYQVETIENLQFGKPTCGCGSYKLVARELSHTTKGGLRMFSVTWQATETSGCVKKGSRFTQLRRGDAKVILH